MMVAVTTLVAPFLLGPAFAFRTGQPSRVIAMHVDE
jgi:hypothetical protein